MCKSHFKAMKRATTPLPKVNAGDAPPPAQGLSVYDGVLPASIAYVPREGTKMPLIAHLKAGFDGLKPPAWHRNEERRARGLMPIDNPACQLEGWERELVWMEILVLTGAPGASFRHLARGWGRDKGFHMVLAQFICERHGDVERKRRRGERKPGENDSTDGLVSKGPAKKRGRHKRPSLPTDMVDIWDDTNYNDTDTNEFLAADIFTFSAEEFEEAMRQKWKRHDDAGPSDSTSMASEAATVSILGEHPIKPVTKKARRADDGSEQDGATSALHQLSQAPYVPPPAPVTASQPPTSESHYQMNHYQSDSSQIQQTQQHDYSQQHAPAPSYESMPAPPPQPAYQHQQHHGQDSSMTGSQMQQHFVGAPATQTQQQQQQHQPQHYESQQHFTPAPNHDGQHYVPSVTDTHQPQHDSQAYASEPAPAMHHQQYDQQPMADSKMTPYAPPPAPAPQQHIFTPQPTPTTDPLSYGMAPAPATHHFKPATVTQYDSQMSTSNNEHHKFAAPTPSPPTEQYEGDSVSQQSYTNSSDMMGSTHNQYSSESVHYDQNQQQSMSNHQQFTSEHTAPQNNYVHTDDLPTQSYNDQGQSTYQYSSNQQSQSNDIGQGGVSYGDPMDHPEHSAETTALPPELGHPPAPTPANG
eukprot:Nitzschia sp. Nitz4//scaffold219_size35776//18289//20211//NITZ4_007823-RA/size35776-processed-gene-0.6-mRNA-1//1//CDS//3329542317//4913//frame0